MVFESVKFKEEFQKKMEEFEPSEPRPEYSPAKADFIAIYDDLIEAKAEAYKKYLANKQEFWDKEEAKKIDAEKSLKELQVLEKEAERGEKVKKELVTKIEEREKSLLKKERVLRKLKYKIDDLREDIEYEKKKIEKSEKKLERPGIQEDLKYRKIKNKLENQTKEARLAIEEKEKEIYDLNAYQIEDKYKEVIKDLNTLRERKISLPQYKFLKEKEGKKARESKEESEYLAALRRQFEQLEAQGIAPEGILAAGERSRETLSKFYDAQGKIFEQIEGGKNFRLFAEMVSGSVQAGFGPMKALLGIGGRYNASENAALGIYRLSSAARGLILRKHPLPMGQRTMRIPSVAEARGATKLYKGREEKETESQIQEAFNYEILHNSRILTNEYLIRSEHPSLKDLEVNGFDIMKNLDIESSKRVGDILYALLGEILRKEENNNRSYLFQKAKELNMLSGKELEEAANEVKDRLGTFKPQPEPEPDDIKKAIEELFEERPDIEEEIKEPEPEINVEEAGDEKDLASKVVEKIFDGMAKAYEKYLESETKDDKGIEALFKQMEKAELKPGIFKKEGRYVKRWLTKMQEWHEEIEKMTKEEIKEKMTSNFWESLVKMFAAQDLKKTGIVRDLTGHMFKAFLLTRRLQKLELGE